MSILLVGGKSGKAWTGYLRSVTPIAEQAESFCAVLTALTDQTWTPEVREVAVKFKMIGPPQVQIAFESMGRAGLNWTLQIDGHDVTFERELHELLSLPGLLDYLRGDSRSFEMPKRTWRKRYRIFRSIYTLTVFKHICS